MAKYYAKIEFGGPCNCFASISWPISHNKKVQTLKIETSNGQIHFVTTSQNYNTSSDEKTLRINGKFGFSLKLKENEDIIVNEINSEIVPIQSAFVTCISEDDWEILDENSEILRNNMLNQLRVVYPGLQFPFWISKSMSINLKIEKIVPNVEFGILNANSIVEIPPKISLDCSKIQDNLKIRLHPIHLKKISIKNLLPSSALLLKNVYHAFIHHNEHIFSQYEKGFIYSKLIVPKNSSSSEQDRENEIILKIFILDSLDFHSDLKESFPKTNPSSLFLHPLIFQKHPNLIPKRYVWLEQTNETEFESKIPVYSSILNEKFDEYIDEFGGFDSLLEEGISFIKNSLSLGSVSQPFIGIENGNLLITGKEGSGKTVLALRIVKRLDSFPYFIHWELLNCSKLRGKKTENVEKELKGILEKSLKFSPSVLILKNLDVLVPRNKTDLQNLHEEFNNFKISETILETLLRLEGKQITIICTSKSTMSLNDYWKIRSGFHFFHKVLHIPPPNKTERLVIFRACLSRYQELAGPIKRENENVLIEDGSVAGRENEAAFGSTTTSESEKRETRERDKDHDGKSENEWRDSDNDLTAQIKSYLFSIHDNHATPQMLHNCAKKWTLWTHSASYSNENDNAHSTISTKPNHEDFAKIIHEEISNIDAELEKKNEIIAWDKIGGLETVKSELVKLLQWPIKYAKLFETSPIKMPTGILLFGYPGTAKTLLALSISTILDTKFIHIKGPELLSKYIGASEQAVQDLFQRAKDSKPCVLFFDEFDSLVPRRGHDSTGVTDRVVNQFLAEMDGIEGGLGQGVYLIAATSRPDLIDPAILRPGRLDKHLFFDLPNQDERTDIFKKMSESIQFSPDDEIDFNEISKRTEGFSGADIHALLFSSQLKAIHKIFDALQQSNEDDNDYDYSTAVKEATCGNVGEKEAVFITMDHIREALDDFKPSLQGKELEKYRQIYSLFTNREKASLSTFSLTGTKTTLA